MTNNEKNTTTIVVWTDKDPTRDFATLIMLETDCRIRIWPTWPKSANTTQRYLVLTMEALRKATADGNLNDILIITNHHTFHIRR